MDVSGAEANVGVGAEVRSPKKGKDAKITDSRPDLDCLSISVGFIIN